MRAPRKRAGRQIAVCCPWCLIVDVEFRGLDACYVAALGPADRPEIVPAPFIRYRCPSAACAYEEIHLETIKAPGS